MDGHSSLGGWGCVMRIRGWGVWGRPDAAVYWSIGEQPPHTLADYTLAGNATKLAMAFTLPAEVAPPGTQVWVMACWLDARLQPGRAETPVSARVGFGQLLRAA